MRIVEVAVQENFLPHFLFSVLMNLIQWAAACCRHSFALIPEKFPSICIQTNEFCILLCEFHPSFPNYKQNSTTLQNHRAYNEQNWLFCVWSCSHWDTMDFLRLVYTVASNWVHRESPNAYHANSVALCYGRKEFIHAIWISWVRPIVKPSSSSRLSESVLMT